MHSVHSKEPQAEEKRRKCGRGRTKKRDEEGGGGGEGEEEVDEGGGETVCVCKLLLNSRILNTCSLDLQ